MPRIVCFTILFLLAFAITIPALAEIGGDDTTIYRTGGSAGLAIAQSGDLFTAVRDLGKFDILRSQDSGITWQTWCTVGDDDDPDTDYWVNDLHIVDGADERFYLTYRFSYFTSGTVTSQSLMMAWASPNTDTPVWTETAVVTSTDPVLGDSAFATDAASFSSYNIYVVFEKFEENGDDIWFARSTNQAASFEASYIIGSSFNGDLDYQYPTVSYGFNGWVHVAWQASQIENSDSGIRYRGAANRASSSGDWDTDETPLASHSNGIREGIPSVVSAVVSGDVLVAFSVYNSDISESGIQAVSSINDGRNWSLALPYTSDMSAAGAFHGPNGFVISANDYGLDRAGLMTPDSNDLTGNWSFEPMLSQSSNSGCQMVSDPNHDDRLAILGNYVTDSQPGVDPMLPRFDAEWFTDPGYLVELGNLPNGTTEVCLTDLEGDGVMEILYADSGTDLLHAYDGHLETKPGFPKFIAEGIGSNYGHLAAGDVDQDGLEEIFITTGNGVLALDHAGNFLPGWPFQTGNSHPKYVSLAPVSGHSYLDVVVSGTGLVYVLRGDGSVRPGFPVYFDPGLGSVTGPVALGDVDADGEVELVVGTNYTVFTLSPSGQLETFIWQDSSVQLTSPVSLADLDLDGDLEIVFTTGPQLNVFNHDGSNFSSVWPWTEPSGKPLGKVALANNWGTNQPEIFVGTSAPYGEQNTAYLLGYNGTMPVGWPHDLGLNRMNGTPLVDSFDGLGSAVIFPTLDGPAFAFRNLFVGVNGWPRTLDQGDAQGGATGDINNDGLTEVVFAGSMQVFATNGPATAPAQRRWPQANQNAWRTGCLDCDYEQVSAIPGGDEVETASRLSFRSASSNPGPGPMTFSYSLPTPGAVDVRIYDMRGHEVRQLLRDEQPAGEQSVHWNGRDSGGRHVASGVYFARIGFVGGGVRESLVRKLVVMR